MQRGSVPWWACASHLICTFILLSSHPCDLHTIHGIVSTAGSGCGPHMATSAPERVLDRLGAPRRHAYTPPRFRGCLRDGLVLHDLSRTQPRALATDQPRTFEGTRRSECDAALGAARGAAGAGEGPVGRRRRPPARRACRRGWYASRSCLRACGREDCCALTRPARADPAGAGTHELRREGSRGKELLVCHASAALDPRSVRYITMPL